MRRGGHGGSDRGPYFVVVRLFGAVTNDWRWFLGYCLNRGVGDPRDLYLDQFCALVWFLMTQDKKPEEIEYQKAQLWIPPAGVEIDERSPWHPSNQVSQLQRVKGSQPKTEGATLAPSRDMKPPRTVEPRSGSEDG